MVLRRDVTYVDQPIEQPNREGSQINHAIIVVVVVDSLTVRDVGSYKVLHSRTTVARSAVRGRVVVRQVA